MWFLENFVNLMMAWQESFMGDCEVSLGLELEGMLESSIPIALFYR